MSEKIVLMDGHSILNRAFYGVPELTNSEGWHTNAVYGLSLIHISCAITMCRWRTAM